MDGAPFSTFMGGFECSTHRRRDGRRLDLIAATHHDDHALADYRRLVGHGLSDARDGVRWHLIQAQPGRDDWSSLQPMLDAAAAAGVRVTWDLMHYGWPDWIDPWHPDFVARFAAFAGEAARRIGPGGRYVAVNEISFLSWGGGEVGYLNPFSTGRGEALKRILCGAAIAATTAVRQADPLAVMITAEPLIHVHSAAADTDDDAAAADAAAADAENRVQFDALDMLMGARAPELGGAADLVDVIGLNYYPYNQFTTARETVLRGDPRYRPLADLLVDAALRFDQPLIVAETGREDEARVGWLRYVAEEVRAANGRGADIRSICLYPILNHPGWDDDRYCPNGLFCGVDTARPVHAPLLAELARQQERGLGARADNFAEFARTPVRPIYRAAQGSDAMIISKVTNAGVGDTRRRLVSADGGATQSAVIGLEPLPDGQPVAAQAATEVRPGDLKRILAAGATAKTVDQGVTLLIEQVHRATPQQVGTFMLNHHLAGTEAAAQSQAQQMLDAVQSKAGGSVLLGFRAGVVTFVVVDSLAPGWSLTRKTVIAVAVAVAAAAAIYFGTPDPQPPAGAAPRPAAAANG